MQALLEYEADFGGTWFMESVLDSRGVAVYLPAKGVPEAQCITVPAKCMNE